MGSEQVCQTCGSSLWKEETECWFLSWVLLLLFGNCPPDVDAGLSLGVWFLAESSDCFQTSVGLLLVGAFGQTLQAGPWASLDWFHGGWFGLSDASLGVCAMETQESEDSFGGLLPESPLPQDLPLPGIGSSLPPC